MAKPIAVHAQAEHRALPPASHDEFARQEFVRAFKEHLVKHVHGGNREVYERKVKPEIKRQRMIDALVEARIKVMELAASRD